MTLTMYYVLVNPRMKAFESSFLRIILTYNSSQRLAATCYWTCAVDRTISVHSNSSLLCCEDARWGGRAKERRKAIDRKLYQFSHFPKLVSQVPWEHPIMCDYYNITIENWRARNVIRPELETSVLSRSLHVERATASLGSKYVCETETRDIAA